MVIVCAVFIVSFIPTLLAILPSLTEGNRVTSTVSSNYLNKFSDWYSAKVEPVQELRKLQTFPSTWVGGPVDLDKNYANFEKWFSDNLGLRNLMIRGKNELDYQLFRSSSRVYFGKDNEIYGRNLVDRRIPAMEAMLRTQANRDIIHRGIVYFSDEMKAQGVTVIVVMPMQKPYFYSARLPFFAPELPEKTNFMALYKDLSVDSQLHMVDVYGILNSIKDDYQIFYTQDFHWTEAAALSVSKDVVNRIAALEGTHNRWNHDIKIEEKPYVGSDARFSARLDSSRTATEPFIVPDWPVTHQKIQLNPKVTGFEFETDDLSDKGLLPATCMYGNSFSDGMVQSGISEYFQRFTKIDRERPLSDIPKLVSGKCKYLIVQILDISTGHWMSFKK
ncbi:hypothetical protein ABFV51_21375 [Pseudomonas asgharzadehiana]|uniref:AlgX/AlgJ SGNH hydrolase-like domain-containing protein n=2 Tax=Pseudomonas TaxID=286 RepID=A0A4Y9T9J2_PSEFL|nr:MULTISPECIES: hypothetical protein [Pseudomonas]MCX9151563.1 hypothetical protein [Pseudomonas sp. TB1-B1]QXH70024.1 hypothetical protein KSS96_11525 [Pseudomonas asgharzadehiana]TFW41073.1 hypothetical protein E4T65_23085 [Pseudomonas fluorescens]